MPQSKSQKPTPSGEELVNKPQVETIEEADPKKKSTYPVQWEYHTMRIQDTAMRLPSDDLDALGEQGWEMIAIFHLHATINFIFKRFALPSSLGFSEAEQMKRLDKLEKEKLEEMKVE
jgi:hypothetical protein